MGKMPVRLKEVSYSLSAYHHIVWRGLLKDFSYKTSKRINENWVSALTLLVPVIGSYEWVSRSFSFFKPFNLVSIDYTHDPGVKIVFVVFRFWQMGCFASPIRLQTSNLVSIDYTHDRGIEIFFVFLGFGKWGALEAQFFFIPSTSFQSIATQILLCKSID